jgi:protein-disulfide isomerase
VVVVLVAILAAVIIFGGSDSDSEKAVQQLEAAQSTTPFELAAGARLGKDDAPIKLTQFEDFQCPFCLRYTSADEPTLIEEYVKTGKMQITYEHFPGLGFESVRAAGAAQCAADQNLFWQYHNLLFLTQAKAGQLDNEKVQVDRFSEDNLKDYASQVGADRTKFDACVDADTHITLVQDQQRRARSLGITGTPGFLINGQPFGAGAPSTLDGWRKLLDDALTQITAAANATPLASVSPSASVSASPTAAATASPVVATTPQPTATR